MKKIFSAVLFALIFMGVTMNANAMPKEKVSIDVYYGTPTLDGKISEGEWDKENAVVLNKDTAVAWMGTVSDDVTYYYSWDDEALYIAVDAVDNDVILPTNINEVFSKDAVQFALDPAGLIGKANGSGGMFFSAGMLKDGSLGAVYHPYGGNAQQFKYTGAAQRTTKGFSFEIKIPWKESIEILAKDGFKWTHGDGQKINFILAMLDRDNNGATSNCYMTAVDTNPKADFTPANYCYSMTLKKETAPSLKEEDLPVGVISNKPVTVNTYNLSSGKEPVQVTANSEIAYRFNATASFDNLSVCCPSWNNNVGNLTFSLYRWNKDYNTTVNGPVITTKTFTNFADNAKLSFDFAAQEAGQYLLVIHNGTEIVGVWNYLSNSSQGIVYKNGQEAAGEFEASIHYTVTPAINFKPCTYFEITEDLPEGIVSSSAVTVNMYNPSGNKEAVAVGKTDKVGYRFGATAPFEALSVGCPSWGNNIGTLRFSIYKWNKDYNTTVSGNALASEFFLNFSDNATLKFSFDELEAGEYLLLLHDSVEIVGVWSHASNISKGFLYKNGKETIGEFQAYIHYTMTPEKTFAACEPSIVLPEDPGILDDSSMTTKDVNPDTWAATDGLGRTLPDNSKTGDADKEKFVGLFYWTWHGVYAKKFKPYNTTQILQGNGTWGPYNSVHHWDEPLYGYYSTEDKWVLRKHAEMLADAGVDVIIFDNTNGTYTWAESYRALFEVFAEARADGVNTPKIAFMLPFLPGEATNIQLVELYNDIYSKGAYQDLWFYWEGKPLIMAFPQSLDKNNPLQNEISQFFTFRPGQAYYTHVNTCENQWGWLSIYPQQVYYNEDGTPEQIAVGVAQNHSAEKGLTAMNDENVFGRTYTSKGYDTREDAELYGANFAEQFEYALEVDPEFIFITGWNEWVALRLEEWQGVKDAFADQYDVLNSRDIEPSKGKLKDHYYYQMVSYIRQFKGTDEVPEASNVKSIDLNAGSSQWKDVAPNYYAYSGYDAETMNRNFNGYIGTHYVNTTRRNDISLAKVARDSENIYFYVECDDTISPYTDSNWMRLLIDVVKDGEEVNGNNWEGYEFILNRNKAGVLESSKGGWNWKEIGNVEWKVSGKVLQVSIPRELLGITDDEFEINFKWADNNLTGNENVDILDFYQYGDVAPSGRFKYVYRVE